MSYLRPVVTMLAVCALIVAGCGGSSKSSSSTSTTAASNSPATGASSASATTPSNSTEPSAGKPLAKAHLIAKADVICARVNKKRTTINFGTQASAAAAMPGLAAFERTAANELATLTAPMSIATAWRQVVRAAQALAEETAAYGEDAKTGDIQAEHRVFATASAVQAHMATVARHAGFKDCLDL